jgi:hypothetical protein
LFCTDKKIGKSIKQILDGKLTNVRQWFEIVANARTNLKHYLEYYFKVTVCFNSFAFALFLPIVFLLYWFICNKKQPNCFNVASYYFYSCWDWRFYFIGSPLFWITQEFKLKAKKKPLKILVLLSIAVLVFRF